MSETNAPEPTMEEILASIRRIISEDEPAAPAAEAPAAAPAALHVVEPEPEPEEEPEDILELTEPHVEAAPPPVETHGDIEISAAPSPAPEPAPTPAPAPVRAPEPVMAARTYDEEPLVGADVSNAAANAFGRLSQRIAMPADGTTLEDVVRELLKPLLKSWLDEHLRAIVEAKVEEEVERVRRRQVG
jgi:cell pole-organizing protein PopZ